MRNLKFAELERLFDSPPAFKPELGTAIFNEYLETIRPEYLELALSPDYDTRIEDLPEIGRSEETWKIITGMNHTHVGEDNEIQLQFRPTFDGEYCVNVSLSDGVIVEVWLE